MSGLTLPSVELTTLRYSRDGRTDPCLTEIDDIEQRAMDYCLMLGEQALKEGDPPVGAVLLDRRGGLVRQWASRTNDKTSGHLLGHAELRAYMAAQPEVGNDLSGMTLVTTSQLCNTCTAPYAEGKIGKIICAVPRSAVWEVAGIMRPRLINMHDLLADGDTSTVVTMGYMAEAATALFALYGQIQGHRAIKGSASQKSLS